MKKSKVPYPENLKKHKMLERGDIKRIREISGIKSRVYVSEIYLGKRKETKRIAQAFEKLMNAKKVFIEELKKTKK
ncbi:MAG: hypothetical protein N4A49_01935 [Marinifilaceae bacterium]|jgi:hypothetical protein|nr:hypothetical protein [Marinifilaceae bacterium]